MNVNKLFKSKTQMIIYIILSIIILGLFVFIGTYDFNKKVDTEAKQINQILTMVPKKNIYKFTNSSEVNNLVNSTTSSGIVLFGFKANCWTNYFAKYVNEVAIENGINEIGYYDFENDRKEKNGTYETIVNNLSIYLKYTDYNTADILAPALLVIKNGNILGYIDDTSFRTGDITPDIYWNDYNVMTFKDKLNGIFSDYVKEKNEKQK